MNMRRFRGDLTRYVTVMVDSGQDGDIITPLGKFQLIKLGSTELHAMNIIRSDGGNL